jgi:hypothetical protein
VIESENIKGYSWGWPHNICLIRCEDGSMIIHVPPDIHDNIMKNHGGNEGDKYFLDDYLINLLEILDVSREEYNNDIKKEAS